MRQPIKIVLVIICLLAMNFSFVNYSQAIDVPKYLTYQGRLTDSSGNAITTSKQLTFKIYDALVAGNLLWTEVHAAVSFNDGYFSVSLGENTALTLDFDQRYWISMEVGSDGEMSPRSPINSVAYSYSSDVAYGSYVDTSAPTASAGALYYNSGDGNLYVYDAVGAAWVDLTSGGASQLSDLSDVNTSTPTDGNILMGDGIDWESVAQTSISKLGTIDTGVWNGTAVAVAYGGTGASDAATARTNLGIGNVEDTALSTWGGSVNIDTVGTITSGTWNGTSIADAYIDDTITASNYLAITSNLSDLNNAATARTNLGLGTAAVQADTYFLQASNNLSDLANAATARTNLGLGNVEDTALSTWGGTANIDTVGTITSGTWNGTSIADAYIDDTITASNYLAITSNLSDINNAATARTNLGLVIGTDVLAEQTIGIADDNLVEIDDADAATSDYAKFTANGLEGRSYAEVKTDLSLNNVENTAISTWAGSSNILTVGTIGSGTWQGDAIADGYISSSGTWNAKQDALTFGIADDNAVEIDSASVADDEYARFTANGLESRSASDVRSDLGLVIGTNVQAYDADLTTYAGITPSSDIQTLLGSANNSAARTNLGLAISSDVQAYDADLTTYAGITPSANIQTLLGSADFAAARTNLGLVIGTDVLAEQTIGIADDNLVEIDDADAEANDYTKLTANGLEGRSYAEVKIDLSLNNVENTAISTWAGSSNITTVGTIGSGEWNGTAVDISDYTNLVDGTNITLSDDTLNVDDAFLLNDGDTGAGAYTFTGTMDLTGTVVSGTNVLVFEGSGTDDNETTFAITNPSGDNTITFQDGSGTVAFTSDIPTGSPMNGTTDDAVLHWDTDTSTWLENTSYLIDESGIVTSGTWQGTAIADAYIASSGTWDAKQDALAFGIADDDAVAIDHASVADDDFAKFTANGLEGRSYSEVRSDLGLVIGTNVQAYDADLTTYAGITPSANIQTLLGSADFSTARTNLGLAIGTDVLAEQTIGIADDNLVEIDDADAATSDYAKFTANGLEGRSYAEVKTDLSLNNVENTAISTWGGSANILTVGTIGTGEWQGTAIADAYIASSGTWDAKQDALTFGIADDDAVEIDDADATTSDYAKFTANGLEGRSYSEVKTDLSLNNVENTAISTWAGTTNITTLGTIGTGVWNGTALDISDYTNLVAGTNISLSDDTLNVDDAFLLNTGDSGSGAYTFTGTMDLTGTVLSGTNVLVFEGSGADENETTFAITNPSGDNTITFQDGSGTVAFTSDIGSSLWQKDGTNLSPATSGDDILLGAGETITLNSAGSLFLNADTHLAETTAADDSGAYVIGVFDEFDNSNATTVQDVLDDLDAAIAGAGSGDVTSVGDCSGGACLDGSDDGGTNISLYDGDSNYGQFAVTDLDGDRTYTFPNSTGTVALTSDLGSYLQIANNLSDLNNAATARTNLGLVIGTDVLAEQTIGIADDNLVEIDQDGVADDDFAKFTANGLEGRSYAEVKTDLSLNNVENTAISTWAGSENILTVGTIGTGTWNGTAIADAYVANDITASNYLPLAGGTLTGDLVTTGTAIDWDLIDNNASALSFDTDGKPGVLNIITTTDAEGVSMSGILNVTGSATFKDAVFTPEASATETEGRVYYDSDDDNLYVYDGAQWVDLTGAGGGASQLSDLSDVGDTTATNGNILFADGDSWESGAQTSITKLGTIDTGTWNGDAIADTYVANDITASNYLPLAGGTLTGDLVTTGTAIDWDLIDDNASALSFDVAGLTGGLLEFDTTNDAEKIKTSGEVEVSDDTSRSVELITDVFYTKPRADLRATTTAGFTMSSLYQYGTNSVQDGSAFIGFYANGTEASPTAAADGDTLVHFMAQGHSGSNWKSAASMDIVAEENFTSEHAGSGFVWKTVANGQTNTAETMTLNNAGALTLTGAASFEGAVTLGDAAADILTASGTWAGANPFTFEGASADDYETIFAITDPTDEDKTITFPNSTGTVALTSDLASYLPLAGGTLTGDLVTTGTAIDWDLFDNNASALSFDTNGKPGILNFITTTDAEGVSMSGILNVTGSATFKDAVFTPEASATETEGRVYYDSDDDNLYVYDGAQWVDLTDAGGGASQLSDLSDVGDTTATNGNILFADGDSWESGAQTSITKLGTIDTGTWNGAAIADAYVADDITASNYLPLAGGTLTGDLVTTGTAIDWDLADNNAAALSFDSAGKAGILNIDTTDSSEGVTLSGTLDVTGITALQNEMTITSESSYNSRVKLISYAGATGVNEPTYWGFKYRGSAITPSAVQSGDVLSKFGAYGYGASTLVQAAYMTIVAEENFTNSAGGSAYVFSTTTNGATSPSEKVRIGNDGNVTIVSLDSDGTVYSSSGTLTNSDPSDRNLKENIIDLSDTLDKMMQLRPVQFDWKRNGETSYGFIAQELQEIFPELVRENVDGYFGIRSDKLVPYAIKAMQEQNAMIQELQDSIAGDLIQGELSGNITVDKLVVEDHVLFNKDTVGQAKILAGDSEVFVEFEDEYSYQPIVTISLAGYAKLDTYYVDEVTTLGFKIKIEPNQTSDVKFNWHAFASETGKIHVSDGTLEDIEIITGQQESQQSDSSSSGSGAGSSSGGSGGDSSGQDSSESDNMDTTQDDSTDGSSDTGSSDTDSETTDSGTDESTTGSESDSGDSTESSESGESTDSSETSGSDSSDSGSTESSDSGGGDIGTDSSGSGADSGSDSSSSDSGSDAGSTSSESSAGDSASGDSGTGSDSGASSSSGSESGSSSSGSDSGSSSGSDSGSGGSTGSGE